MGRAAVRKPALLVLGVVLLSAATACGGGTAGDGSPPVPSNVQQTIHDRYGRLGFIPARVPDGYDFRDWIAGAGGFSMQFGLGSASEMQFGVNEVSSASAGGSMHTFKANGVAVEWSATEEDQQAWRCLTVGGTPIVLLASRSVPGDVSLDTPKQQQDAQQLVDLVAYAQVA